MNILCSRMENVIENTPKFTDFHWVCVLHSEIHFTSEVRFYFQNTLEERSVEINATCIILILVLCHLYLLQRKTLRLKSYYLKSSEFILHILFWS